VTLCRTAGVVQGAFAQYLKPLPEHAAALFLGRFAFECCHALDADDPRRRH
jgi:hypothetical protein